MPIRITGLNSGLDTESIIKQLVSAYSVKKDSYVKAQTKLSWKQEAWKSLNSKIYSLYTSIDKLRFTSAYTMKTASVSDTTKATVKASNSAVNGSYTLKVEQTAKSGYLTGAKLGSGVTENSKLSDLGYSSGSGTISVTSGGNTTSIAVDENTTISDFVKNLNDAGVKASYDSTNNRIYVAANDTGVANDFSITGSTATGTDALTKLGLNARSNASSATYSEWAAYAKNSDGGDYFTFNANGTVTTNGTYDVDKTQSAIQQYLDAVETAKADNDTKKAENEVSSATISDYSKRIAYAEAYASTQSVLDNLSTEEKKKDLTWLSSLSDANLQKSYQTDDQGNLLYDGAGDLIEVEEGSPFSVKGEVLLKDLQNEAGLLTQKTEENEDGETVGVVDEEGNPVMDTTNAVEFTRNIKTVLAYEADAVVNEEKAAKVAEIKGAYANDSENGITNKVSEFNQTVEDAQASISTNNNAITANNATIRQYSLLSNGEDAATLASRITYAAGVVDGTESVAYSQGATRVNGQDAIIYLNDAQYQSSTNTFEINGLTIEALAATGNDEVTITTKTDTQGLYDKIKGFLKQYNDLMIEMTKLYNADSAKGYNPLTTEEKDSLTDSEIEEWDKKIKDALLRRDGTLDGVMSVMKSAMSKSYTINGKTYSLSSFGISTLGILNSEKNQEGAYHIDGDSEDSITGSRTDKLMAAITNDPDSIIEFMKQLTSGLYDNLDKKMKSTPMKSIYNVYNDKQMNKEYSDYTTTIKKWEQKVTEIEDRYYKKFAAMEKALATLQSNTSSLTSLFGNG